MYVSKKFGEMIDGGITVIYLSKKCPYCKQVYENRDKVTNNLKKYFTTHEVIFSFIDEDDEFFAHGFEAVPTVCIPNLRPIEGIAPIWLIDEEYTKKLATMNVNTESLANEKELERLKSKQMSENKWWKNVV
jgi:hypothetical protein